MGDNNYTKTYSDGTALAESNLDSAYKSLKLDISNTTLLTAGSTDGQALISNGPSVAASFQDIPDPLGPFALRNYGLSAVASSNLLVIRLKTKALSDPSSIDVVNTTVSTAGTVSATYTPVNVTSARSISVNASATLGNTGTSAQLVFVYGYNNSGTLRLAVSSRADLDTGANTTTTALSNAADSDDILYATATLAVVPRLLGWVEAARNSSGNWQTPIRTRITNNTVVTQAATANRIRTAMTKTAGTSVGVGGVARSNSSGSFSTSSSSALQVTNLSASIITTGRPVELKLIPTESATSSYLAVTLLSTSSGGTGEATIILKREGVEITRTQLSVLAFPVGSVNRTIRIPPGSLAYTDIVVSGNYTYTVEAFVNNSDASFNVQNCQLVAYELA